MLTKMANIHRMIQRTMMLPTMATMIMRLKTTVQLTSAASDILQIVTKKKKIRY